MTPPDLSRRQKPDTAATLKKDIKNLLKIG